MCKGYCDMGRTSTKVGRLCHEKLHQFLIPLILNKIFKGCLCGLFYQWMITDTVNEKNRHSIPSSQNICTQPEIIALLNITDVLVNNAT